MPIFCQTIGCIEYAIRVPKYVEHDFENEYKLSVLCFKERHGG